jgi:hypothetical protein
MPTTERREFLAVYDYGMGGIWMKILAGSREEIASRYPQLTVYPENERPEWLTEAAEENYTRNMRFDLDAHEGTWLARFDHEHGVEVMRVYGTGDEHDGWSSTPFVEDGSGWHEQPGAFFIAQCYCGWHGPMRDDEETAFRDGREHYPASTTSHDPPTQ